MNLLPARVLEFFDHSGDQSARSDAERVPNNQWFCLQLDLKVSEVGGASASIDGSPSVSIASLNLAREGEQPRLRSALLKLRAKRRQGVLGRCHLVP